MTNKLPPISIDKVDPQKLPSLPLNWRKGFPKCPAIYFAMLGNKVLYIGRTNNLLQRWEQHHRRTELESMGEIRIAWMEVSDPGLLPAIEKALIQYFKPLLNSQLVKIRASKGGKPGRKGGNPETYFRSSYQGEIAKKSTGVKLPVEIDVYIRSLPNKADWLRQAAIEKYERETGQQLASG